MSWQITVLASPTLFATIVALFLAGYTVSSYRSGRRDPIVVLFFWIAVATAVWTGFSALKLLHTDPETKLLFYRLLHVGVTALPPLFFLFVVAYTDRTQWLRPDIIGGVFLLPSVFVVLTLTDPANLMVAGTAVFENDLVILRVTDGPGFLLFSLLSAIFVLAALGLTFTEVRRVGSAYYLQAVLIGIAIVTPFVTGVLTTAGIPPFTDDRMNLVPASAAISTTAFGLLVFRYRLFDLPPLAHATAMKYSPDSLFVLDRSGRVVHTNDHGRGLLERLNGRPGATLLDHLSGFDPETASDELFEIETPAGPSTHHRALVEPLVRGGRRVGWVVVLRDESVQQRHQLQLQQQNVQMGAFSSTVSHDLRNPLNVARGYLEIAREESESDSLDQIDAAHARMEEIITQLLTLARGGRHIDETEPTSIPVVVERAWESVKTTSASLSVEIDRTIEADPTMLQHVFENLFRNAIEHGGADVNVRIGALEDGLFVEDDGPGIPEPDRETVFDSGYSTSAEGTGFGLQIVETIVNAHGWTVAVDEAASGGARFEITGVGRARK